MSDMGAGGALGREVLLQRIQGDPPLIVDFRSLDDQLQPIRYACIEVQRPFQSDVHVAEPGQIGRTVEGHALFGQVEETSLKAVERFQTEGHAFFAGVIGKRPNGVMISNGMGVAPASHVGVVRPVSALRRAPGDVLCRILDIAGLAVNAVLEVDNKLRVVQVAIAVDDGIAR